jgi:hypothetical protein
MQYNFGAGFITAIPSGANPTPVKFGVLKEVSIDLSFTVKELRGAYMFPVDIARSSGKIAGKIKNAQIDGSIFAAVLTGATSATGQIKGIENEAGTIPTTPFTITVAQGATFSADLGVINYTSGQLMTRVASAPATGQYSVNTTTGVYTFNTAQSGNSVGISYQYTVAGATGSTLTYTNQLMGSGSVFAVTIFNTFRGKDFGFRFPACTISKLALPLKSEDYSEQDLDFDAFADASNNVLYAYTANS